MTDEVAITYKDVEYTLKDLSDMPMVDLIELHNDLAQDQDKNMVTRFETRGIGIKRVWDMLRSIPPVVSEPMPAETIAEAEKEADELYEALRPGIEAQGLAPAPVVEAVKPSARKKREMYFQLPLKSEIKPARKGTLRYRVLQKLLAEGLTFDQVIQEVKDFDADRAKAGVDMKGSDKHPERRAYEIVRIVHYYLGYGLKQSPEGVITAFDKKD